jgi:hypothetical protein
MQVEQIPNMSPEALKKLEELYGKIATRDDYSALWNQINPETDLSPIRTIAKETKRITTVSLHKPGEIVTLSCNRKYQVADDGKWIRINSK